MNLHVQQSVHVLAAQTYCQIAVGGGGAVKGVRHLKRTIPTILSWTLSTSKSSTTKLLLAMKKKEKETIFPPIFESQPRDLTSFYPGYEAIVRVQKRGSFTPTHEGQHDIDLPSTRCQTRRDWNVPILPTSQMSIRVKSYFPFSRLNHHPLWAWNLAMFFFYRSLSIFPSDIEIRSYTLRSKSKKDSFSF